MQGLNFNVVAGSGLLILTFALFLLVILKGLGGEQALFAILGHVAAWAEVFVIYLWRKKPPTPPAPPTP